MRRPARRLRGLTLLEMLVTLVIASLVAGVVAQALVQIARVERLLEGGQLGAMADSVRAEWVRAMLASLLPGEPGRDERLQGQALELTGLSADSPILPAPGISRFRLRLTYDPGQDRTELQFEPLPTPSGAAHQRPRVLLGWPGRGGRFRYLDVKGEWQDEWRSLPGSTLPALPVAIALDTGIEGLPLLVAALRANELRKPTRRELEAL